MRKRRRRLNEISKEDLEKLKGIKFTEIPKGFEIPRIDPKGTTLFNPTSMQKTVGFLKMCQGFVEMLGIEVVGGDDAIRELASAIHGERVPQDGILICKHGVFECDKCREEAQRKKE